MCAKECKKQKQKLNLTEFSQSEKHSKSETSDLLKQTYNLNEFGKENKNLVKKTNNDSNMDEKNIQSQKKSNVII